MLTQLQTIFKGWVVEQLTTQDLLNTYKVYIEPFSPIEYPYMIIDVDDDIVTRIKIKYPAMKIEYILNEGRTSTLSGIKKNRRLYGDLLDTLQSIYVLDYVTMDIKDIK